MLLQSHPNNHETVVKFLVHKMGEPQICVLDSNDEEFTFSIPSLRTGWHRLAIVSSTLDAYTGAFAGTRVFVDEWTHRMEGVFVKNEFHVLGNDIAGKQPFGCVADFRIYARTLRDAELEVLMKPPIFGLQSNQGVDTDGGTVDTKQVDVTTENYFPDQIVRRIHKMGAIKVLASRLDIIDSAAESLRALGSLATLQEARAEIFGICGPKLLELAESPLPMVRRQAARLLNNLN